LTGLRRAELEALKSSAVDPRDRVRIFRRETPTSLRAPPLPPLYAATRRGPHGEQVVRYGAGTMLASVDPLAAIEEMASLDFDLPEIDLARWWKFDGVRVATAADLRRPAYAHAQRPTPKATRLVGAVASVAPWRWALMEGASLSLTTTSTAVLLAPNGLEAFDEVVAQVRRQFPKARWICWHRRRQITPVTLDEFPAEDQPRDTFH